MKALRSLSGSSKPPTSPSSNSRSRRTSSRTSSDPPPPPQQQQQQRQPQANTPASAFAFTQINVANFDRAEAFFARVFGWRFIGEPVTPAFLPPPPPPPSSTTTTITRDAGDDARAPPPPTTSPRVVAPPIAPPPDHRVNYFALQRGDEGRPGGHVVGALFKFGPRSRAGNYGGRRKARAEDAGDEGGGGSTTGERARIPPVIGYVAVEDMAVALNAVRLAGGRTVVQPWTERDGMARLALFEDTEGNVFGLIQYLA